MSSLIGWGHTQNDPCICKSKAVQCISVKYDDITRKPTNGWGGMNLHHGTAKIVQYQRLHKSCHNGHRQFPEQDYTEDEWIYVIDVW